MMRGGTISLLAILLIAPVRPAASLSAAGATLDQEARQLGASRGLARRDGTTLTIRYNGRPVAAFTNGNPYCGKMPCDGWQYVTRLSLRPAPEAPPEPHALVAFQPYQLGELAIVDRDGRLVWFEYNLRAQDGGRYIAGGSFQVTHTRPHFIVIDWASAGHRTGWRADIACEPLDWRPDDTLTVVCKTGADEQAQAAAFHVRRAGVTWQLTETGSLSPDEVSKALSGEPYRLEPLRSPRRTFMMTPMTYDESQWPVFDGQRIDRRAAGYKRLVWPQLRKP